MAGKESKDLAKTEPARVPMVCWDVKKWFERAYGRPYSLARLPKLEFTVPEGSSPSEAGAEEKIEAAA